MTLTTHRDYLGIGRDALDDILEQPLAFRLNPVGLALAHGRLVATIVSEKSNEQLSLELKCRADGSWRMTPFKQADVIYVDQPRSGDHVATYVFPDRVPRNPRLTAGAMNPSYGADPKRVAGARLLMKIAIGTRPLHQPGEYRVSLQSFCLRCGRELDREESIEIGFGPDCAAQVGIPHEYRTPHQRKRGAFQRDDGCIDLDAVQQAMDAIVAANAKVKQTKEIEARDGFEVFIDPPRPAAPPQPARAAPSPPPPAPPQPQEAPRVMPPQPAQRTLPDTAPPGARPLVYRLHYDRPRTEKCTDCGRRIPYYPRHPQTRWDSRSDHQWGRGPFREPCGAIEFDPEQVPFVLGRGERPPEEWSS